jgi:hypothetical protein
MYPTGNGEEPVMDTSLTDSMAWARTHFGAADLGDRRLNGRLVRVAAALARKPHGTLPGSFDCWAEMKAAYRLLGQEEVTYQKIICGHWDYVRKRCREPGEYLLLEDNTQLDYTSPPAAQGLGFVGDGVGRGIMLHSTLALRVERWEEDSPQVSVVGLYAQKPWVRQHEPRRRHEKKADRLQRARESQRWAEALRDVPPPPAGVRQTYVADRESDVYEVYQEFQSQPGREYIVRACWARALDGQRGSVFAAVAASPVRGRFSLDLRARPGAAARTARLELRGCTVTLRAPWRPGGKGPPCTVQVVEAREVEPPPDVKEPLHWVLLTSWPAERFEQALRAVKTYARRELIEEYHKALKTGVGVEASELSTCQRLLSLLAILAVVAVRLLDLKFQAVTAPDQPADPGCVPPQALAVLEKKCGRPRGGWTNATTLVSIARLGGFPARKGDGRPGWLTIWRGMKLLIPMLEGYTLAKEERCG